MHPQTHQPTSPSLPGASAWITPLINACRETQVAFEIAAGGAPDRLLRAELIQYSGQRREFIAELIASQKAFSSQVIEPGNVREPLERKCNSMCSAVEQHDVEKILRACEAADASAMEVYRVALAAPSSSTIHALLTTQIAAITRVRDRVQRLRLNAQSSRN